MLVDTYNKSSCFDNTAIKADFEEIYQLMNGKPLKEIDEIIYAVCTLCRDYEKVGLFKEIKMGIRLSKELLDNQFSEDISCTQLVMKR